MTTSLDDDLHTALARQADRTTIEPHPSSASGRSDFTSTRRRVRGIDGWFR